MTFGEKLFSLRKRNGISQEELANHLNVSRQAISKWETGSIPDVNNILRIASFFDCSLDFLLNEQCEENIVRKERTVVNNRENEKETHTCIEKIRKRRINTTILYKYLASFSFLLICLIYVFSIFFPAPLFKQNAETGNWLTGIGAFIEYHGLQAITLMLFLLLSACILGLAVSIVVRVWPDRREKYRQKQLLFLYIATGLSFVGIGFLFYRFFFLDALLWNLGLVCVSFLYLCMLSVCIMLYQQSKNYAEKGGENTD